MVEAQLELKLANSVGGNKKCFSNMLTMNTGPKLTLDHYPMRLAISKRGVQSKRHSVPSSPLSSALIMDLGAPRSQEPQNWGYGNNNLLDQTEHVWDLLLQLGIHKSVELDGILPRMLKELADVITRHVLVIF